MYLEKNLPRRSEDFPSSPKLAGGERREGSRILGRAEGTRETVRRVECNAGGLCESGARGSSATSFVARCAPREERSDRERALPKRVLRLSNEASPLCFRRAGSLSPGERASWLCLVCASPTFHELAFGTSFTIAQRCIVRYSPSQDRSIEPGRPGA